MSTKPLHCFTESPRRPPERVIREGDTVVEGEGNQVNSPTIINIVDSGNTISSGNVTGSRNCTTDGDCSLKRMLELGLGLELAGQLISGLGGLIGLGNNSTNSEQSDLLNLYDSKKFAIDYLC